jgi:hypothetical protein
VKSRNVVTKAESTPKDRGSNGRSGPDTKICCNTRPFGLTSNYARTSLLRERNQ